MDLSYVISQLRSELESLDEVILSLEKLSEIRRRRTAGENELVPLNGFGKAPRQLRQSAGGGSRDTGD